MKKINFFRRVMPILALLVLSVTSAWAGDVTATLTGSNLVKSGNPGTSYADYAADAGVTDDKGFEWTGRWCYQKTGSNYLQMVQIKAPESSVTSRLNIPTYPGNIKSIKVQVTNSSATSYSAGSASGNSNKLYITKNYAKSNNAFSAVANVVAQSTMANKEITFDFTSLDETYTGEGLYIVSSAAIRIWSVAVVYAEKSADQRQEPTLSFASPSYTKTVGESFTAEINNPQTLALEYSSSKPAVASVNRTSGEVSALTPGTTTISAVFSGDQTYKPKTITYSLTVEATPLTTMDEIFAAATTASSTATDCRVTFNNWVVSGVKNNNAYVTDNAGKGFIIYQSGHGFAVGDILSGTAACKVQLYHASAEITTLTSTTNGLSVTKGGVITPVTSIELASLSGINTGAVLSYEDLQYNGTNFTDGETNLKPYNALITLPSLISGKNYNVSGVYVQYDATKEIAPRTEEDFVLNEVINKYVVTIETPENGTLTIKDGENIVNNGDEVAEGTILTIVCTPVNADYRFKNWGYKDGESAWVGNNTSNFTHEMPSSPCSFRANFELIPVYTVAWSVNGTIVKTDDLKENTAVTAPANPEAINGKVFKGWIETATVEGATPAYVTPITTATKTVTYYAVFATESGTPASLTKLTALNQLSSGDNIVVIAKKDENTYFGLYQQTQSSSYVAKFDLTAEPTVANIDDEKKYLTFTKEDGSWYIGDATNGYLYSSSSTNLAVSTVNNQKTPWVIEWNSDASAFKIKYGTRYLCSRTDLTSDKVNLFRLSASDGVNNLNLYRYTAASTITSGYTTTPAPVEKTVRTGLTEGDYGTICFQYAVAEGDFEGAVFFSITGKIENDNVFAGIEMEKVNELGAGVPYIYRATAATINFTYLPVNAETEGKKANGLIGSLVAGDNTLTNNGTSYILSSSDNKLHQWVGNNPVTTGIVGKAYIDVNQIENLPTPPEAPTRVIVRVVGMEDTATSLEAIGMEKVKKFFENGQIYILKAGHMYDVTGRLVK